MDICYIVYTVYSDKIIIIINRPNAHMLQFLFLEKKSSACFEP